MITWLVDYRAAVTPTVAINVRTEYTYDLQGNRLSIRNGTATLNSTQDLTTFTYDDLDRPLTEADPLGHTTTHTYTLAGVQATRLDASNRTTAVGYDGARRLTTIDYPTGTADVTFT